MFNPNLSKFNQLFPVPYSTYSYFHKNPPTTFGVYAHDDQGDDSGQATEGSTVSSIKCDCCWHLY